MRQRGSDIMRDMRSKKRNGKDKIIIFSIISIVTTVIVSSVILFFVYNPLHIQPNMEVIYFRDYHNLSTSTLYIVFEGELVTEYSPIYINDELFLPSSFLTFAGPHIYWEPNIDKLTITTQTELMRILPGESSFYLNFEPSQLDFLVHDINNEVFLPLSFVQQRFDISYELSDINLLIIDNTASDIFTTTVIASGEDVFIRHEPDIQSYIVTQVNEGDILRIFHKIVNIYNEDTGEYELTQLGYAQNYTRVRTYNGVIGFIYNDLIDDDINVTHGFTRQQLLPRNTLGEPIILAWDLITNSDANYLQNTRIVHQGVNVMAPKWLRFERESYSGTLENISSSDYVAWAHANGMQVWPLLFDYQDPLVATEILSQTHLRDYVINQLIDIALQYNFDGIMIDIEGTNANNQEYFLQFLRELSPIMRQHNLIYSVAVFVPAPWRLWYNHEEIGRVLDYVAVMAYDQNVASVANSLEDATAGPNASISFVTQAVDDLVAVMDSDQIILGLPFYTRIWYITESYGTRVYSDRPVGIQFGQNYFINAGANLYWSEYYGSYFSSFTTTQNGEEVTTLAWIETERSLDLKARLVNEYNLAGVAGWQRSLATPGVWAVLENVVRP